MLLIHPLSLCGFMIYPKQNFHACSLPSRDIVERISKFKIYCYVSNWISETTEYLENQIFMLQIWQDIFENPSTFKSKFYFRRQSVFSSPKELRFLMTKLFTLVSTLTRQLFARCSCHFTVNFQPRELKKCLHVFQLDGVSVAQRFFQRV